MLQYLTDILSARVGGFARTVSDTVWLSNVLFGIDGEGVCLNPLVMLLIRRGGYSQLAESVSLDRDWFLNGWLEELWPRGDYTSCDLRWELLDEFDRRNKVVPADLCYEGFGNNMRPTLPRHPLTGEKREAIREVIRERFTERSFQWNRDVNTFVIYSYDLKHWIENLLDYHVSNGEVIEAMLLEGYRFRRGGRGGRCYFYGQWRE